MLILPNDLSAEAIQSLAKEWVISKVSDTEIMPDVELWTAQTIAKINTGELLIEFGEESQTVTLKTKDELSFTHG
ncbi:MAG: YheU family protein [Kangiellaceae bacterium]|nr:YheU family protein [Kangiellaceae bacterium]